MILGRTLRSLSYLIDKEERDWRRQNKLLQQLVYRGFSGWLSRCADSPLKNALELLILCFLVSLNFSCWGQALGWNTICWADYVPGVVWNKSGGREQLLSLFLNAWTLQATLAALTYPIVIAFVTILVQRNASSGVLRAYFIDSAAIFAGLSSLFVLIAMLVQYVCDLTPFPRTPD